MAGKRFDVMQKGERFNRLVYLGECRRQAPSNRYFGHFECDCGKTVWQSQTVVKRGINKSCGCFHADRSRAQLTTHGATKTPEFSSWTSMRNRCRYPCVNSYNIYGGRGIKVCARWLNSFENFLSDVGRKPFPGAVIDRIDSDKDYEPGNVRWLSVRQNSQTVSTVEHIETGGVTKTIPEWSEVSPVSANTIRRRLRRGATANDAIFNQPTPPALRNKKRAI